MMNTAQECLNQNEARHLEQSVSFPTRSIARPVLTGMLGERAAEYEQQCKLYGGLSLPQKRALKDALRIANEDGVSAKVDGVNQSLRKSRRGQLPFAIGTEFIREWKGHEHIVVMTDNGLLWSGQTFKSLSAVAYAISGTKWNGYRFFGIDRQNKARP